MYVSTHMSDSVLCIPDEDEELEVIHVLVKNTVPNLNIMGCNLDVESRHMDETCIKSGSGNGKARKVIFMGDLNRHQNQASEKNC